MISEGELRRKAASWQVDPMVVDLDYSLGWFLAALYAANREPEHLRFKGGTCLRKCHFGDYRFSEDLDFSGTLRTDPDQLREWIRRAAAWSLARSGPSFEAAPWRVETVSDTYGEETYQVRVYYRGPLRYAGSPRAIRVDLTRNEVVLVPSEHRRLIHPYSDKGLLDDAPDIVCYALEEIFAEKLRAVAGQRRFAVSRDLYDIHRLVNAGVSVQDIALLLQVKFAARGLDIAAVEVARLEARRAEFERDWRRRLSYLVRDSLEFDDAWSTTLSVLHQVQSGSGNHPS